MGEGGADMTRERDRGCAQEIVSERGKVRSKAVGVTKASREGERG
jgi:hypothetical protein